MPHYLVKDPTNKYGLYSTIVDALILVDVSLKDAIESEIASSHNANYPGGSRAIRSAMLVEAANIEKDGVAYDWADDWEGVLETTILFHGREHHLVKYLVEIGRLTETEIDLALARIKIDKLRETLESMFYQYAWKSIDDKWYTGGSSVLDDCAEVLGLETTTRGRKSASALEEEHDD